ncbi:hypothetical protein [Dendrosporobacter sp. 1207_IL3150]|uniref:hypothetical protein n=1 Tax=Dendrosporobacter sp. 1207_IL3150 TaxID=3084054 RepID=UPI002FD8D078
MAKGKQIEAQVSTAEANYELASDIMMPIDYCKWVVKKNNIWTVNVSAHEEFKGIFPNAKLIGM